MTHSPRINKLQSSLKKLGCEALMIEDPINLLYLTGLKVSTGKLLINGKEARFLLDSRYFEMAKKACSVPVVLSDETKLEDLVRMKPFEGVLSLGFDGDTTSYSSYLALEERLHQKNPEIKLIPCRNPVKELRAIKDNEEIAQLRAAAALGSEGYDYICTLLKEGVTEVEIATELEIFWKRKGGSGLGFDPIIAFGANSSMPHYRAGNRALKYGDTVLIDIGVNLGGYHSDMTRVVFFGEPDPRIKTIYAIVLEAQQRALDLCRAGVSIRELDIAARGFIEAEGYGRFFSHGLGHGVGLEIHELPSLKNIAPYQDQVLEPGMVVTIEPGIYLPDVGGVRIEDTVVVTQNGHENLTCRDKQLRTCK